METILNFTHIQAVRETSEDISRDTTLEYPIDLYIRDVKEEGEHRAVVSFRLDTTTSPEFARFSLGGDLVVQGSEDEVKVWITPSGRDPPRVWKHIYQEGMSLLAVLAKMIEVPFPAPKIGAITVDR